jgi:membrane AbrB-like protein
MNSMVSLAIYLCVGTLGGYLMSRFKMPAGAMLGAMLAVVLFKLLLQKSWPVPRNFGLVVQVLVGVMVGVSFHPDMIKTLGKIIIPVTSSTFILVGTGFILALIYAKTGLLDINTAYLGTSPGAMAALVFMALETQSNATVVATFHFFRIFFIVLTAPLLFKYISN